jgi:hypothetical protein
MPRWDDRESRLVINELNVLLTELGCFNNLIRKKIRFNIKPISNKTKKAEEENNIDLHLELVKEIDDLLERHEQELERREPDPLFKTQKTLPLKEFIEFRDPETRRPEVSKFPTEFGLKKGFGEIEPNGEFLEVEAPTPNQFQLEKKEGYNRDLNSWMMGEKDKKFLMSFGKTNVNSKASAQKQTQTKSNYREVNGLTKTKIDLERTKKEIEERKKALEEAIRLEKEKEEELKRKAEEKKKEEKQREIEKKQRLKEKKIREKERLKLEKRKEKELKKLEQEKEKQEKIKQLEQEKLKKEKEKEVKKLLEEKEKQEKIKQLEQEKLEKEKEKELKKLQAEQEILERLKEKEEKLKKIKIEEEIKEESPIEVDKYIQKESTDVTPHLDSDVEKLLPIIDELLEKLPEDVLDEFANSKNFTLYEKVITKYKRK